MHPTSHQRRGKNEKKTQIADTLTNTLGGGIISNSCDQRVCKLIKLDKPFYSNVEIQNRGQITSPNRFCRQVNRGVYFTYRHKNKQI